MDDCLDSLNARSESTVDTPTIISSKENATGFDPEDDDDYIAADDNLLDEEEMDEGGVQGDNQKDPTSTIHEMLAVLDSLKLDRDYLDANNDDDDDDDDDDDVASTLEAALDGESDDEYVNFYENEETEDPLQEIYSIAKKAAGDEFVSEYEEKLATATDGGQKICQISSLFLLYLMYYHH